jgi:hypothetical protein
MYMKKMTGFFVVVMLVLGMAFTVSATSSNTLMNTNLGDLYLGADSTRSFTVTGSAVSNPANYLFKSATVTVEFDVISGTPYASYYQAWFDGSSSKVTASSLIQGDSEYDSNLEHWVRDWTATFNFDTTTIGSALWSAGSIKMDMSNDCPTVYLDDATLTVNYNPKPVPEPSTLVLVGCSLLGLGLTLRRKITV